MSDGQGRMNPNPLSNQEIRDLAQPGKPYAHAFQGIPVAKRISNGNDLLDSRIT
jgi:hypothetical protein